jgi:glycosyltransferase involved in cell wall biosynthesis
VEFLMAGDGTEFSALERSAREISGDGKIRLLRHVRDMPSLYDNFDIMVSSSRREGLPMAVLEAMASSLPVIATAVGDVPKVIDHGRTGMLAAPDDDTALAEAILDLIRDPSKRARLGAAGRQFVSEVFSHDRMGREYLQFYETAILNRV